MTSRVIALQRTVEVPCTEGAASERKDVGAVGGELNGVIRSEQPHNVARLSASAIPRCTIGFTLMASSMSLGRVRRRGRYPDHAHYSAIGNQRRDPTSAVESSRCCS